MKIFKKNLRRMLLFSLIVCTLSTITVHAAGSLPFRDVSTGAWYYDYVKYTYEKNLMTGTSPVTYEPEAKLTRAMFITVLGRIEKVNTNLYTGGSFPDVPAGRWYSSYVKWGSQKGIITGYTNTGLFGPEDLVTREQMATMIARYLDYKGITLPLADNMSPGFKDAATVNTFARKGLEIMRRTGIITGNSNGNFYPHRNAIRAEAAAVFKRLVQALENYNGVQEEVFVEANQMQMYNGKIYTIYPFNSNVVTTKVPGALDGSYSMLIAVYKNYIYYTEDVGTSGGPTNLYRMSLNGSNKKKIISNCTGESFCIYNDRLYYTVYDSNYNRIGKSIDLNTLKTKTESYYFLDGSDEMWLISDKYRNEYCSYPGFVFVQSLPEDYDWIEEGINGIYEDNMYYFQKYSVMTSSIYDTYSRECAVGPNVDPEYWVEGSGIYYYKNDSVYFYRYDLDTHKTTKYDIRNYDGIYNTIYPINEVNGKLYYVASSSSAMIAYELNLSTGAIKNVGSWHYS